MLRTLAHPWQENFASLELAYLFGFVPCVRILNGFLKNGYLNTTTKEV